MYKNSSTRIINGCVIECATRSGSTLLEDTVVTRLSELGCTPLWLREVLNHNASVDYNLTSWSLANLEYGQTPNFKSDIWHSLLLDMIAAGRVSRDNVVPVMRAAVHAFDLIGASTEQSVIRLLKEPTMLRILLLRTSVKDQISSMILTTITGIYNIKQEHAGEYNSYLETINQLKQNPPPVDKNVVDTSIRSVLRSYQYLSLSPLLFDQVVWYEDMINGHLSIPELDLSVEDTCRIMSSRKATRKLNDQTMLTLLSCIPAEDRTQIRQLLVDAESHCNLYSRGYDTCANLDPSLQ